MPKVICVKDCHINPIFLADLDENGRDKETGEQKSRPPAPRPLNHDARGIAKTYRKGDIVDLDEILIDGEIPGGRTRANKRTGQTVFQPYFKRLDELAQSAGGSMQTEIREYADILGYSDKDLDGLILAEGFESRRALLDHLRSLVLDLAKKNA